MLTSIRKSELFLISLVIFCQSFSYIELYFIKNTFDAVGPSSSTLVLDTFLFSWFTIASIGKIAGAYFFGKFADKLSFFTVMQLMTVFSICRAFLMLIIIMFGGDFYVSYKCLYLVKFLSACLLYAIMILPAMYLFDKYTSSKRILAGTCIRLAYFASRFFSYAFAHYIPIADMKSFGLFTIAISSIPFFICAHLKKYSSTVRKTEVKEKHSYALGSRAMCVFIGIGWNVGRIYHANFITPYMKNISIVENCSLIAGNSLFFMAQLLFLLPAASICKKFGTRKTLLVSLFSLAILGLLIPFFATTKSLLVTAILLFSLFSACLFVPILTILYGIFKNTKNLFETLFWFAIGSSVSKLFFVLSCKHGFSTSHPSTSSTAGITVFIACITACLVGVYSVTLPKNKFIYTKKMTTAC